MQSGRNSSNGRKERDDGFAGLSHDRFSDIEAATASLANPDIGVTQIARRLGVSPATLYRYIPVARTANTPGE